MKLTTQQAAAWLQEGREDLDMETVQDAIDALLMLGCISTNYWAEVRLRGLTDYAMTHDCPECPSFEDWKEATRKWEEAEAQLRPVKLEQTRDGYVFVRPKCEELLVRSRKSWSLQREVSDD